MHEDKALLGYSFWSFFFATAAEDDEVRNLSLSHVNRALPGLGIFKDQSDEDIVRIVLCANQFLTDNLSDEEIDFSHYSLLHLSAVQEAGLAKSLYSFLISIIACCGQSGETQMGLFGDVADEVGEIDTEEFRDYLRIYRELHGSQK